MKRKVFIIVILILFNINTFSIATDIDTNVINEQGESFGINDFIHETEKYSGDFFEDINVSDLFSSAVSGKIDNKTIGKKVLRLFGREISSTIKTFAGILVIVLIHSILKALTDNLNGSYISQIIYYVEYILIITLIMSNFSNIIETTTNTITNLVGFMNTLVPLLTTLMIFTGSIATSGVIQPILLFTIEFTGNVIVGLIIPCVSIIAVFSIVSKISDKIQIEKINSFLKSSVVLFLGIILTIFVGVLSLEGTLTSSVDGITAKTAKAAVSNMIPIVGKILGDSVDSILGCGLVLKNAVGTVGVIVIIGICIMPVIKLATLSIMYSIASGIIEPLADGKIVKLLNDMGGIFKILLAILCAVSVLLIIGITLVIKISNSGMMYR